MTKKELKYQGDIQPKPGETIASISQPIYPYSASEELRETVNLAIILNRPLLLEGEPGCGKSRLAHALVYEFSKRYKIDWPYQFWGIQSTSKAEDGFYTYDYIGRLQAAQLKAANIQDSNADPSDRTQFIEPGALWEAFEEKQHRTVVLIDEIDKAEPDLLKDLLIALEDYRFECRETKTWITADEDKKPIILMTSNQDRELPPAFLRRCLYHYIEFPDRDRLTEILNSRFPKSPEELVTAAIHRFCELREAMEEDKGELEKKVSTSELIIWFEALIRYHTPEAILEQLETGLPFAGTLLKNRKDYQNYARRGE
jgi:MoxR-like ATPase